MSIADIFTVVIALLALLVNVVFATFQITWSITQDLSLIHISEPTRPS